jgi:nitrite reductase/ring-hydroxylating ferredoxin subunit
VAAYRTYAIAAPLVRQGVASGTFWDSQTPYHYTRTHVIDGRAHLIVGGEDHRVGSEEGDEPRAFERLQAYVNEKFAGRVLEPTYRWSGQILEPVDGLPYVGKDAAAEHVFVATGYAGNGITWGTLAGFLLADLIRGIDNPWRDLLDATRIKPLAGAKAFLTENVAFPQHYLMDRLKSAKSEQALTSLPAGQGDIFRIHGQRLAVYKDDKGQLSACSAVCPHLGCLVHWNPSERSWDCPCHGSRFDPHGAVLNGPANAPLAPKSLDKGG